MILAIDTGNTNTAIGCVENGGFTHVFSIGTDILKTADEYAAVLDSIFTFNEVSRKSFSGAILSCVVPPLTEVIKAAVKQLTGFDALIVGAGIKTGMNILIDDPGQLGSDMVSTAVAALSGYTPPIIIVDLGTATKITVLNERGSFIGGAILPGVALSMTALSAGTSQLPKVPVEAPARCISTNTTDCMKSGAIFGAASMIDGMVSRCEAELDSKAVVVATGGLAEKVYRHCKREIIHDPHLLLRGLALIYDRNVKTNKQHIY